MLRNGATVVLLVLSVVRKQKLKQRKTVLTHAQVFQQRLLPLPLFTLCSRERVADACPGRSGFPHIPLRLPGHRGRHIYIYIYIYIGIYVYIIHQCDPSRDRSSLEVDALIIHLRVLL